MGPDDGPILVTGGAGYVGSETAALLVRRGFDVVVLDDLGTGHRHAVPEGAAFIQGSLLDEPLVSETFRRHRFAAVLHCAAPALVGESFERPFRYLGDDVRASTRLVEVAARAGVGRFVFSSSAAVYGPGHAGPIAETAALDPGSPYGEAKRIVERVLHWADRVHGMRSACLRYFNVAGADPAGRRGEDHRPETHLVPLALRAAQGRLERVVIHGVDYPTEDGTCVRDYVHVTDLAEAHLRALDALERGSVVCNLGTGRGHSVRQVVAAAEAVTGREIPVSVGERRPGDPATLVAGTERAAREIGWTARMVDLGTILETAWRWHRDHPDGYGG